jgi:hypothetical protein
MKSTKSTAKRGRVITAICTPAAVAGLLLLTGCTHPNTHAAPPPSSSAHIANTLDVTPATAHNSSSPSTTSAAKAEFCRDINTAVNVLDSPGTNLSAAQSETVSSALESANQLSVDTPDGTTDVINALLADIQAPTTNLPPSFATNQHQLAQDAATYCG